MADRIQLSRDKGWRMPKGAVKVDRSTPFGNPFKVGIHGDAAACTERFRALMRGGISMFPPCPSFLEQAAAMDILRARLPQLRGKTLACWCRLGEPCHADVLLELANV
jgi:hypothetical protein